MSVTYGFYNSKNHDRRYNAIQMSSIFDGIIRDGIFMSIGECLVVSATGEDMVIRVGEGRAWFNHTWTLNDSKLPLEVPQSEIILNRIDVVVLEVNSDNSVRENSIKIIKGTPSSNPVRPEMIHTASVNQYPLAFIKVDKEVTSIRQADITNMVGSDSAPYVTGILETVNIEAMVAQWEDQWVLWLEEKAENFAEMDEAHKAQIEQWTKDFEDYISISKEQFDAMIQEQTRIMLDTKTEWNNTWLQWFGQYTSTNENAFNTWFGNLQAMLEPDVAANLANEILKLQDRTDKLEKFRTDLLIDHAIYDPIKDRKGEAIQDSMGRDILGRTIFLTAGSVTDGGGNTPTPSPGSSFPEYMDEWYEAMDKLICSDPKTCNIYRNQIYRGKEIEVTSEVLQGLEDGTYRGLFIGDYWVQKRGVCLDSTISASNEYQDVERLKPTVWRICHFDYYKYTNIRTDQWAIDTRGDIIWMPDYLSRDGRETYEIYPFHSSINTPIAFSSSYAWTHVLQSFRTYAIFGLNHECPLPLSLTKREHLNIGSLSTDNKVGYVYNQNDICLPQPAQLLGVNANGVPQSYLLPLASDTIQFSLFRLAPEHISIIPNGLSLATANASYWTNAFAFYNSSLRASFITSPISMFGQVEANYKNGYRPYYITEFDPSKL